MFKSMARAGLVAALLGAAMLPAHAADPSPEADKALWCKAAFETVAAELRNQDQADQATQMDQLSDGMEQIAVGLLKDEGFSELEIASQLNAALFIDRELLPGGSNTRFTSEECLALIPDQPAQQ